MKNTSKKKLPMTNIGITTIITVFIIVSLVTFASLSYVNAKNDNELSIQAANHNDQYYEAYNQAYQQIAKSAEELAAIYDQNDMEQILNIPAEYTFDYPVGTDHKLYVTLVPNVTKDTWLNELTPVEYLEKNNLPLYRITRFEVETTKEWDGNHNILPLKIPENE